MCTPSFHFDAVALLSNSDWTNRINYNCEFEKHQGDVATVVDPYDSNFKWIQEKTKWPYLGLRINDTTFVNSYLTYSTSDDSFFTQGLWTYTDHFLKGSFY